MAVSLGIHASFTIFKFLGMAVFLLLMLPVTNAKKKISLNITDVDAFCVTFNCSYNYDGDMTDVMFAAFNGSSKCLERSGNYSKMKSYHSSFHFLASKDPKSLKFGVRLDRSCNEVAKVRCEIRDIINGSSRLYGASIKVPAQSDTPILSVNDGQPVEASSSELTEVTCRITNVCHKAKPRIFGGPEVLKYSTTTYTYEDGRFTVIARAYATFSKPGIHRIFCEKEKNNGNPFNLGTYELKVAPSKKELNKKDVTNNSESMTTLILW